MEGRDELLRSLEDATPEEMLSLAPRLSATLTSEDWAELTSRVRRDGVLPLAWAWRAGSAAHQHGRLRLALELFGAAEPGGSEADRAQLLAAEAATRWLRGETELVRDLATRAMEHAVSSRDESALAVAWATRGLVAAGDADREANLTAHRAALRHAEAADDLVTQVRVHANLTARDLDEGRYADAVERAQAALPLQERSGHLPSLARLREHLAQGMLGLGRLDEALLEVETARAVWSSVNAPARERAGLILGDIQATRGNVRQARIAYQEAVRVCEAEHDHSTLPRALAGLAKSQVLLDPAAARAMVEELLQLETATGQLPAILGAGWVHLALEERESAAQLAREAVRLASDRQDYAGLAESLELSALAGARDPHDPGLAEAASIWLMLNSQVRSAVNQLVVACLGNTALTERLARERLSRAGVHNDAPGIAGPLHAVLSRPEADVLVHVLGTFVVFRSGEAVGSASWPSKKARDLLKILAARGQTQRDVLVDLLWGSEGTGAKLSVALSQLRAVLDPERRHGSDHFVLADRGSVRLHPQHVSVDLAQFRVAAQEALAAQRARRDDAVSLLEAAAAMYTGTFAADDLYEDWATEPRQEAETLGAAVNRSLAYALAEGPSPEQAVPWLSRLLNEDPYDEPTYRLLVGLLAGARRHGAARALHRTYVLRMGELGVTPATFEELAG